MPYFVGQYQSVATSSYQQVPSANIYSLDVLINTKSTIVFCCHIFTIQSIVCISCQCTTNPSIHPSTHYQIITLLDNKKYFFFILLCARVDVQLIFIFSCVGFDIIYIIYILYIYIIHIQRDGVLPITYLQRKSATNYSAKKRARSSQVYYPQDLLNCMMLIISFSACYLLYCFLFFLLHYHACAHNFSLNHCSMHSTNIILTHKKKERISYIMYIYIL